MTSAVVGLAAAWCLAPSGAWAVTPTPYAPQEAASAVLYQHATLIDGTGGPVRQNMDILVMGERIQYVLPHAASKPPPGSGTSVVDLQGQYLMPGLVDSHVHLATPPNRRQAEAEQRRNIYGGVTAVRDMADDLRAVGELARASLVGEIPGPDIYYAALMSGPDFFDDPRTIQVSAGGIAGQVPWMQSVTEDTDLALAVARAKGTSATAIKLYADLSGEAAARISKEAHRQRLLVWAHATLFPAKPSEVVDAGADVISHACLLTREADADVPRWKQPRKRPNLAPFKSGSSPALVALFAKMVERRVILDATVWTYGPSAAPPGAPPPPPGLCDDVVGGAITGQAFRAGVQIAAGTDAVAPASQAWPELLHEMQKLVELAGMQPSDVIHSATLIGARAAGQDRDMGSIEAGKLANMLVLKRDPTASIDNLKSLVMTVKRGRMFRRSDFVPLQDDDITDFN